MSCQQCVGIEKTFDHKTAQKELEKYHKKGPAKTTRFLINFFLKEDIKGCSLLDIGGGIGVIQHELIKMGVSSVINVDASSAYLDAAQEESRNQGHIDKIQFYHGDFVKLKSRIPSVDIVTLERVVCCYPDMVDLVENSISRANKWFGIIYPRDNLFLKLGFWLIDNFQKLLGREFRVYLHSQREIHALIQQYGFEKQFAKKSGFWTIEIFEKPKA